MKAEENINLLYTYSLSPKIQTKKYLFKSVHDFRYQLHYSWVK